MLNIQLFQFVTLNRGWGLLGRNPELEYFSNVPHRCLDEAVCRLVMICILPS